MAIYKLGRPRKYNPSTGAGQKPPAKPGEYRIRYSGMGEIVYIGETNNISRRMKEHIRNGKLPTGQGCEATIEYKVADGRSSSATRRAHERSKIRQHHPALNQSKGGEGRLAGKYQYRT